MRVSESIRESLAREAAEAIAVAEAEDDGQRTPAPGQRARQQAKDPAQVYSVRIPVDRIEQLRRLAEERGAAPTTLLRQLVLEVLDREEALKVARELSSSEPVVHQAHAGAAVHRDLSVLNIGGSRSGRPIMVRDVAAAGLHDMSDDPSVEADPDSEQRRTQV